MCAILGYLTEKPDSKVLAAFKCLLHQSRIRGMHAYGFTWVDEDSNSQTRKFLTYGDALEFLDDLKPIPHGIIGHCRYSTSGDFKTLENNQPLDHRNTSLLFNGTIDMRTLEEMKAAYPEYEFPTDNDGWIAWNIAEKDGHDSTENMSKWLRDLRGSFAGIWWQCWGIRYARNENRPMVKCKAFGATFLASTEDIVKRAFGSQVESIEQVEPYVVHELS